MSNTSDNYARRRERQWRWEAAQAFADHQLLSETYWDDGRGAQWTIGRPQSSVFLAQIVAGRMGSLIVHGDIDVVRFAQYSDHRDAYSRLLWMAACQDIDYYVAQKASIGMGAATAGHDYNEEHAEHYLRDLAAEADASGDTKAAAIYREAITWSETEHRLYEFLQQEGIPDAWELDFTMLKPSVVYAHASLQRTMWLLIEKYGDHGPPECEASSAPQYVTLDLSALTETIDNQAERIAELEQQLAEARSQ